MVLFDVIDVLGEKKTQKKQSLHQCPELSSTCVLGLFCVNNVITDMMFYIDVHNDESDISSGFSPICLSIFIGHVYI